MNEEYKIPFNHLSSLEQRLKIEFNNQGAVLSDAFLEHEVPGGKYVFKVMVYHQKLEVEDVQPVRVD